MPQSLSKVTKHITRKKGKATGLHERSRDAAKLRKASAREERVHRANAVKARAEEGYVHRVVFFQAALRELDAGRGVGEMAATNGTEDSSSHSDPQGEPPKEEDAMATDPPPPPNSTPSPTPRFGVKTMQSVIQAYISSLSSLHPSSKSYRTDPSLPFTPFRPAAKTAAEEKALERQKAARREYAAGFWCPDLRDRKTREGLGEWKGDWAGLNVMIFVRVDNGGRVRESTFPPRGGG